MDDTTKRLIEALKKKREAEGHSLRSLASAIGVSFSSLGRMERGEGEPDNNSRIRILEWLGEDAHALGLSFESFAYVHFRAGKNIGSQTVHCLFQVADFLKHHYGIKRLIKEHTPTKSESPLPEEATLSLSKPEMEAMAHSLRQELGLKDHQALDPRTIVVDSVKVLTIQEIHGISRKITAHLEGPGSTTWSAMSVPIDEETDTWIIVLNDLNNIARQNVSLLEEFWHILLGHKLTKIAKIADAYGRTFDESEEHDAFYLAAATLLPKSIIRKVVKEQRDTGEIVECYGVSPELVEYRIKRLGLWRAYRGKKVQLKP